MHNYPNFLNLLTTFMYIPLSFAYIIPVAKFGWLNNTITSQQLNLPKKPFAIMGFLDCLAGIMQIFAATYLPGPLLVLLAQMAIPVSLFLSKTMLSATYAPYQYFGAAIVAMGIVVVLAPTLNGGDGDAGKILLWSGVMILSCVPMTLSSIYKEMALGSTELDPVFLNGWIAVFQFLFSIPLAIPSAMASDPPVYPSDLMQNLGYGLKCWLGIDSITADNNPQNVDSDDYDDCSLSIAFVNVYLVFNVCYNILIILILKFGNANILWLAMTIMVPVGNLTFALPFLQDYGGAELKVTDVLGLVVIMSGLCLYRFGAKAWSRFFGGEEEEEEEDDKGNKPLLSPVTEEEGREERRKRVSSEEPERMGGVGRVGKSF